MPLLQNIIGGLADFFLDSDSGEEQMDFNAEQAQKNRDFQERMSNTEVQRRKADLEKAGFNPMMAVMNNAASSPSGSSASSGAMVRSGVNSAVQVGKMNEAQIELLKAQSDKARSEAAMARAQVPFSASNAEATNATLVAQAKIAAENLGKAIADHNIADLTEDQLRALQPLMLEAQSIAVQAAKYGLSEAEAMSDFYEAVGGAGKFVELAREVLGPLGKFLPFPRSRGGSASAGDHVLRRKGSSAGSASSDAGPRLKPGRVADPREKPDWRDYE